MMGALLMLSCSRKQHPAAGLEEIEALLQTAPDSGYNALCAFDISLLRTPLDTALYRLLKAEALYKTWRDDTALNDIEAAADYFIVNDDRINALRGCYYLGLVHKQAGDTKRALRAFMRGMEFADTTKDFLYLGKLNNELSVSFNLMHDGPTQVAYAAEAMRWYRKTDSIPFIRDARNWWLTTLCNNQETDSVIRLITTGLKRDIATKDTAQLIESYSLLATAYQWEDNWPKAIECFSTLRNLNPEWDYDIENAKEYLLALLVSQTQSHNIDEYVRRFVELHGLDNLPYQYWLTQQDYRQAFESLHKNHLTFDSVYVASLRDEGHHTMHEIQLERETAQKRMLDESNRVNRRLVGGGILLFLIIACAWYGNSKWQRYKMKVLLIRATQVAKDSSSFHAPEKKELSEAVKPARISSPLIRSFLSRLNNLCNEYYSPTLTAERKKEIEKEIGNEMNLISSDKEYLLDMEAEINRATGGLLVDVYSSLSTIKSPQKRLVALLYFEFSPESLCVLLNTTRDALYSRRSRLKAALSKSSSRRTEELLKILKLTPTTRKNPGESEK